LVLLPLDGEVVAFSEAAQSLIGLNTTAAAIVGSLQAGKPATAILSELASQGAAGPAQAQEWLDVVLNVLASGGFMADRPRPPRAADSSTDEQPAAPLTDMPPHRPFNAAVEQRYRLLDTCALIRFREGGQARMVNTIIGHLATDDDLTPTLVIDLWAERFGENQLRSYIYCDGEPAGYAQRLSFLGPIVKGLLWRAAVNAHRFLFYIHAGVIGASEGCVLFPAAPGSGKSSLTAAMTSSGFRYFSDEVALVETLDLDVCPMPLAFCSKRSGWDVMARYFPEILRSPMHRRGDGKDVKYVPPPRNLVQDKPARVSHIIFPKYNADSETRLISVPRAEALRRLMDECLALKTRLNLGDVHRLVDALCRIDCYALTFSSLDEAVELVSDAIGQ
jgi:hypothetical protein